MTSAQKNASSKKASTMANAPDARLSETLCALICVAKGKKLDIVSIHVRGLNPNEKREPGDLTGAMIEGTHDRKKMYMLSRYIGGQMLEIGYELVEIMYRDISEKESVNTDWDMTVQVSGMPAPKVKAESPKLKPASPKFKPASPNPKPRPKPAGQPSSSQKKQPIIWS